MKPPFMKPPSGAPSGAAARLGRGGDLDNSKVTIRDGYTLVNDPMFRISLARSQQDLAIQGAQYRTFRFGPKTNRDEDRQVMAMRYLFVKEFLGRDLSFSRELHRLFNSYAREYRDTLNFETPSGVRRWGWAKLAFPNAAEPFRLALSTCLTSRKLDVAWMWDVVLFTFELWYGVNSKNLYDRSPEVFVPPTVEVHRNTKRTWALLQTQVIAGESRKQRANRLRKEFRAALANENRDTYAGTEFDAGVAERGVKWLVEIICDRGQILSIAEREGLVPRTIRRHVRLAADLIGYPLPPARVGRPRKEQTSTL